MPEGQVNAPKPQTQEVQIQEEGIKARTPEEIKAEAARAAKYRAEAEAQKMPAEKINTYVSRKEVAYQAAQDFIKSSMVNLVDQQNKKDDPSKKEPESFADAAKRADARKEKPSV